MTNSLLRTPLYQEHLRLGAKVVPFAGWEMPVQYRGLIDEHRATRQAAGLFDVSHMGEIEIEGADAARFLQWVTCNDITKLDDGRAQYNALLNEQGGVIDDIIVYRKRGDRYLVCVNASNTARAFAWLESKRGAFDLTLKNASADYAQLALQGPKALAIAARVLGPTVENIPRFQFREIDYCALPCLVARTGYTGEDGIEVFLKPGSAVALWQAFLEAGQADGIQPVGLGARDTLRLEACLPLHGHELGEDISALESGLGWIVKTAKGDFIGKAALTSRSPQRVLVGFEVLDQGLLRHGDTVLDGDSTQASVIGRCTSGTKTPTCNKALGLALVESRYQEIGSIFHGQVRDKKLRCRVVETPFYRRST